MEVKGLGVRYKTLEGDQLEREDMKRYIFEAVKYAAENKDFNIYAFMNDLRTENEMNGDEMATLLKEINTENQEN